jgi:hypothetical protein
MLFGLAIVLLAPNIEQNETIYVLNFRINEHALPIFIKLAQGSIFNLSFVDASF